MLSDVYITMLVFDQIFSLRHNNIYFHLYENIEITKILHWKLHKNYTRNYTEKYTKITQKVRQKITLKNTQKITQ